MDPKDKGEQGNSGELEKKMDLLAKQVGDLTAANDKLKGDIEKRDSDLLSPQYLAFLEEQESGKPNKNTSVDAGAGVDYDDMSRAQLVKALEDGRDAKLTDMAAEVKKQVDAVISRVGLGFAQMDIRMAKKDHPDFKWDDHKEQFYTKAKDNPSWSADKVIKDIKRDLKEAADTEAAKKEEVAAEELKAITEKGDGVSSGATQDKVISKDDAADAGFQKAFGNKES